MDRAARRRFIRETGIDPRELERQRQGAPVEVQLQGKICGYDGQRMDDPQFHPPPDYACAKAPLMKPWKMAS